MKKAIVIAITMMLGLGLTAFAGPLSGSWASSLVVDPAASSFTSLSSTLAVDYTVSGWTFTSITDLDEAGSIMTDVVKQLRKEGIDITPEISLRLVTLDELGEISEGFKPDQLGIAIYESEEIAGGFWSRTDYKICILYGLPAYHFRVIIAHELMHIWLYKNGPTDNVDLALTEGSCNYAAYLILRKDKSEKGQLLLERFVIDKDPIYGEGFRKVRDFVDKVGIAKWLSYLTKNRKPPW